MGSRNRPLLHLALFLATCGTTVFAYYSQTPDAPHRLFGAIQFACCTLLILGSHEMGHYLMARRHGVDASLPYFIPMPLGFGTMGAVIRIRARIPTRDALVDIGAAGPLAGLAVAIPLLIVGTAMSKVVVGDDPTPDVLLGPASLSKLLPGLYNWLVLDQEPALRGFVIYGNNLLTMAVALLLKGTTNIRTNPVMMAAWFGLLITMFNLFPIGQLDGGHLTHAWFGPRAVTLGKGLTFFMAMLMAFCSVGWLPWLLVTGLVIGYRHPEVIDPLTPLSRNRKIVCALCFAFFVLTLMPVPITMA